MSSTNGDHLKMDREYLQEVRMHKLLEEFVVSALKVKPINALRYLHEWSGDKLGIFDATGPPPTNSRIISPAVATDEERIEANKSAEVTTPTRERLSKRSSDVMNANLEAAQKRGHRAEEDNEEKNDIKEAKTEAITSDQGKAALRIQCAARSRNARRQRQVKQTEAEARALQASLDAVKAEKELEAALTQEEAEVCGNASLDA